MNFALGTELTNTSVIRPIAPVGPINTASPQINGGPEIGGMLSVTDGTWVGNGSIGVAYQWIRDGANIGGAVSASYFLANADDQALISCHVSATDLDGTTVVVAVGITAHFAAPVFIQQPTILPATGMVGAIFTLTLGDAGPNAVLSLVSFAADGVDKSGELSGLSWDSSGAPTGTISMRVMATNSGGLVLSDVVTAAVMSATANAPAGIADGDWTLSDAGAGGSFSVVISAMADDGGAPILAVEYQLDGAGAWIDCGLRSAGGFSVGGLSDGQQYSLALRVVNGVGNGVGSSAKTATPTFGNRPTVGVTGINVATGAIDMAAVSQPGTYFGLINYSATPLAGNVIEAGVVAGTPDSFTIVSLSQGTNSGFFDKANVAAGTAYFHGSVKTASGQFTDDVPLAFVQPIVDVTAPTLVATTPTNGAVNQPTGAPILLTFDEAITLASGQLVLYNMSAATVIETFDAVTGIGDQGGTISVLASDVSITPGSTLPEGAQISIRTIDAGMIADGSGNGFAGWTDDDGSLNFTTLVAGTGAVFIGDADSTTWGVNHILDATSNGQSPLPPAYAGGNYVIASVAGVSKDVTSLSLDGVSATLRANVVAGSERVAIYDVTIPGGGNGLVSLGLSGGADDVGVAIWEVGNRSFVGANAQHFANRKTDLAADLSIDTTTGDTVLVGVLHSDVNATSTWNGLTETVASRVLSDRVFAAAHSLSSGGGSPESFQWAPTNDWVGVGAALAVYR